MARREALESNGWIYICCESPELRENSKQLDEMRTPHEDRLYVPAHELKDVNFSEALRTNLRNGRYMAVFFRRPKIDNRHPQK